MDNAVIAPADLRRHLVDTLVQGDVTAIHLLLEVGVALNQIQQRGLADAITELAQLAARTQGCGLTCVVARLHASEGAVLIVSKT